MTVKDILAKLESMGDEARQKHNARVGPDGAAPPGDQFGVKLGDIRAMAKKLKGDRSLALGLWETGNLEAQLLATQWMKPASLTEKKLDALTRSTSCAQAAEWLNAYVVALHPARESLREKWMSPREKDPWAARAGWHFTASAVNKAGKDAAAMDVPALLDRIEKEMPRAKPEVQWTMNNTLIAIGVRHVDLRERAIAIGERIGLYKDWPMSKGCIIPYVPVAVPAMARRVK